MQPVRPVCPFLSSTFVDFQEERDVLVKRIFPALESLCRERGTFFSPVDLRWGITEEQAESGDVIRICLDHIEYSAPFFIGLLGDRYGQHRDFHSPKLHSGCHLVSTMNWLDKSFLKASDAGHTWILQEDNQLCSVTELEIRKAVSISNLEHCYFYFRAQSSSVNHTQPEDTYAMQKMAKLKNWIANETLRPVRTFHTPTELGELVLEDWYTLINNLYPAPTKELEAQFDIRNKNMFLQRLQESFVGNSDTSPLLEGLSKFYAGLTGKEHSGTAASRLMVIAGCRGSGKTTAIAQSLLELGREQKNIQIVSSFIGSTNKSEDISHFLRDSVNVLGNRSREIATCNEDENTLYQLGELFWTSVRHRGSPCLVVIDGLDYLGSSQTCSKSQVKELCWIPEKLPDSCKLVVSTNQDDITFDILKKRSPLVRKMNPIRDSEPKTKIVHGILKSFHKTLTPDQTDRIVVSTLSENPLFLTILANELRVFGSYEQLDMYLNSYLTVNNFVELWKKIVRRWTSDYGQLRHSSDSENQTWVDHVIGLLSVSHDGLHQTEIMDILHHSIYQKGNVVSTFAWEIFVSAASSGIQRDSSGLYQIVNSDLKNAIFELTGPSGIESYHTVLADYFTTMRHCDRRTFELPGHLIETSKFETLRNFICEKRVFMTMYDLHGDPFKRQELLHYWDVLRRNGLYTPGQRYRELVRKSYDDLEESGENVDVEFGQKAPDQTYSKQSDCKETVFSVLTLKVGQFLAETSHFTEAEEVLKLVDRFLRTEYKDEPLLHCEVQYALAEMYYYQLRKEDASFFHRECFKALKRHLRRNLGLEEAQRRRYTQLLGESLCRLGTMKLYNYSYREAQDLFNEAEGYMKTINDIPGLARIKQQRAKLCFRSCQWVSALDLLEDALEIREKWFGRDHSKTAEIHFDLGDFYADRKPRYHSVTKAHHSYKEALRIRQKCLGNKHLLIATTLFHMGKLLCQGSFEQKMEGIRHMRHALDIREEQLGPSHAMTEVIKTHLAKNVDDSYSERDADPNSDRSHRSTSPERTYRKSSFRSLDRRKQRRDAHRSRRTEPQNSQSVDYCPEWKKSRSQGQGKPSTSQDQSQEPKSTETESQEKDDPPHNPVSSTVSRQMSSLDTWDMPQYDVAQDDPNVLTIGNPWELSEKVLQTL